MAMADNWTNQHVLACKGKYCAPAQLTRMADGGILATATIEGQNYMRYLPPGYLNTYIRRGEPVRLPERLQSSVFFGN
ncbi:MAG: hypothetical protein EBQ80_01745 [Proteobacteria bacterium]|nr:hypothetical protein [Pseudomonadota bacterium]